MSSSIHGRIRQFIGRIEVPSNENIPCFDIQRVIEVVLVMLCGDQGVHASPSST